MGGDADLNAEGGITGVPVVGDFYAAVGGADDAHIMSHLDEVFGQGSDHIGESANFNEWFDFGRDK